LTFTPNRPGGHGKQADDPVTLFEVPTAQGVQAWALDTALKDPMGQSTQPLGDTNLPAGQVDPVVEVHAVAAEEPTGEVVPEGHGVHTVEPTAAAKVPMGQGVQAWALDTALKDPMGHGVHTPGEETNVPGAQVDPVVEVHAVAAEEPTGEVVPEGHGVHDAAAFTSLNVLAGHWVHAIEPAVGA